MSAVLNSWKNAKGETVIETATGLKVLPLGQTVAQWQRAQAANEEVAQIDGEVAKHPGVVAVLDERTGAVGAFLHPATNGADLSAAELRSLRKEAQRLQDVMDDPRVPKAERQTAGLRLTTIQRAIERLEGTDHLNPGM